MSLLLIILGVVAKKQPKSSEESKKAIYLPFHRRSYSLYNFYRHVYLKIIYNTIKIGFGLNQGSVNCDQRDNF